MPVKIAVALLIIAVIAASFWAHRVFAQSIVHDPTTAPAVPVNTTQPVSALDFTVKDIDGKDADLSVYRGKVVMIVNVASRCGFTRQYASLEDLFKKYADQGFVVIGFPANNFNQQEPGSDADIKTFCSTKFNVTFPMMSKISVKGDDKAPLYKFLTESPSAGAFKGDIGWNFTKFLVDRNGNVIARFASKVEPSDDKVVRIIERALAAK